MIAPEGSADAQARPAAAHPWSVLSTAPPAVTARVLGVVVAATALAWVVVAGQAASMNGMATAIGRMGEAAGGSMAGMASGVRTTGAAELSRMWAVMMVAMMLPTMVPMLLAGSAPGESDVRHRAGRLTYSFGVLAVWVAIGVLPVALLAGLPDLGSDRTMATIGGLVLVTAGLYQFTPWKGRCLSDLRTAACAGCPVSIERGLRTLGVGLRHGLCCVGCCWALMAIMLVVGLLLWMIVLSVVFLLEKTWTRGLGFARIVGVALVAVGTLSLADASFFRMLSGASAEAVAPGGTDDDGMPGDHEVRALPSDKMAGMPEAPAKAAADMAEEADDMAKAPVVAGAPLERSNDGAMAEARLARTGPRTRPGLLLAGLALLLGGTLVAAGAPRPRPISPRSQRRAPPEL